MSPRDSGGGATRQADPRWTLFCCILASSLSFVDGSVMSVALPAIRNSYGAGAQQVQWVVNAYLLPLSALLLLGGAVGDHFGRKRLLIVGTSLLLHASPILCPQPAASDAARISARKLTRRTGQVDLRAISNVC